MPQSITGIKEFLVTLHTIDKDEFDAPGERKVAVDWDAGVTPDWKVWLNNFNSLEDEPYEIHAVKELSQDHTDEM